MPWGATPSPLMTRSSNARRCVQVRTTIMDESAKNGLIMNTGCSPKSIKKLDDGSFELTYSGPDGESTKSFDQILMATGRGPNTANLGLENAGVELDNKGCGHLLSISLHF